MPQLYLPAAHTDADLVLAGQVAELIESAELHVAWTPAPGARRPRGRRRAARAARAAPRRWPVLTPPASCGRHC